MHNGTIINVIPAKGYGFIFEKVGAPDVFFHAKDVIGLDFDETLKERRVSFDVVDTGRGPRAANVQALDPVPVSHKVTAAR
jgi:CspA family cold shock protein